MPPKPTDRLTPFSAPRPVRVQADDRGRPTAVAIPRGALADPKAPFVAVTSIEDRWRIDDDWWRKEISRMYWQVSLASGRLVTVYQDLIEATWFIQNDTRALAQEQPLDVLAPLARPVPAVAEDEKTG